MKKKKVLIATNQPWNNSSVAVGDHHYAELLSEDGHEVFWLSRFICPFHIFKRGTLNRFKNWLKGPRLEKRVLHYTPLTLLPYLKFIFDKEWIGKNCLRFTIPPIRLILKKAGFLKVDMLWITDLSHYFLTEIVDYDKLVLRLVDDVPAYDTSPSSALEIQQDLVRKADFVFITSKNLMKYKQDENKFFYIPNGVEINHFTKEYEPPETYQEIESPRIIFVGGIHHWVNTNLIEYSAQQLPNYNFVLVGPSDFDLLELKKLENVYILGPKPYEEVPAYMQHADVGMIPFKVTQLTQSVSPIKMFEYFAAGIPVVSTRLKESIALDPPALFAKEPEEFVNYIEESYQDPKPEVYREYADKNSWQSRYKKLKKLLNS